MRDTAQENSPTLSGNRRTRSVTGRVFFLGLLLVAAVPAAIITCAIMLPVKLFHFFSVKGAVLLSGFMMKGKESQSNPAAHIRRHRASMQAKEESV